MSLVPGDSVTSVHLPHVMKLLGEQILKVRNNGIHGNTGVPYNII